MPAEHGKRIVAGSCRHRGDRRSSAAGGTAHDAIVPVAVISSGSLGCSSLPTQGATLAVYAEFITSEGNFTVRLFDQEAPNTVENFIGLAEGTKEWTDPRTNQKVTQPYYDGIIFTA